MIFLSTIYWISHPHNCTKIYIIIYWGDLSRKKPELSDEFYKALNKIEWFTANAMINSKTQIKINTFLNYKCIDSKYIHIIINI